MTALIQVTIDDNELRKEGLDARTIVDRTTHVIASYYEDEYEFNFDVGYNPQQIITGGRN